MYNCQNKKKNDLYNYHEAIGVQMWASFCIK